MLLEEASPWTKQHIFYLMQSKGNKVQTVGIISGVFSSFDHLTKTDKHTVSVLGKAMTSGLWDLAKDSSLIIFQIISILVYHTYCMRY